MSGITYTSEIAEIAGRYQHLANDYTHVGIRVQDHRHGMEIGQEVTHCSNVWDDGNMLDEQLDGICAIDINRLRELDKYCGYSGRVIVVMTSEDTDYGQDPAEIIMRDAKIVDIFEAQK